ncbi:hypothetical protein C0J09_13880 [Bordetella avium]|uniref:hypothetical protein n=1 Tax=Bordetella avium TaxID=521 RepID=UPI000FDBDDFF|nr:hypothetical protein [Bordetella avium]AZY50094.1 hypothetical protein C0J09_13880 [Bordetella avium]
MPIKVTKAFQWSPNGYDVATVDAGEYETLPERASEIAVQLGAMAVDAAPLEPAAAGGVPQLPGEGGGQELGSEQPVVESAEATPQTSEPSQGAVIKGGAEVPEVKAGRRRNRSSEPANG